MKKQLLGVMKLNRLPKQNSSNRKFTFYSLICIVVLLFSSNVNAQSQVVQSFTNSTANSLATAFTASAVYKVNDYVHVNDAGTIRLYRVGTAGTAGLTFTPSSASDVTSGSAVFLYSGIAGSSSQTWLCPTGVTSIQVEAWGAGGAGGSTAAANSTTNRTAGGGGAGSYVKKTITVVPGTTYNLIVGQGGYKGQTNSAGGYYGTVGGRSEFSGGSISALIASGGTGGTGAGSANMGSNPGGVLGGVYGFSVAGTKTTNYGTTVTLSGGGGSGATAISTGSSVSYIAATNQGTGFTSNPSVSVNTGAGLTFLAYANPNINSTGEGITTTLGSNGSNSTTTASGAGGANAQGEVGGAAGTGTAQGGYNGSTATNVGAGGGGGLSIWTAGTSSSSSGGAGANGKIVLTYTAPIVTYTYAGTGDLHNVSNWKDESNNAPANFTADFQIFKINTSVTTTAPWTVSGSGSKIVVGDNSNTGVSLTIASGFGITSPMDVTDGNKVYVQDIAIFTPEVKTGDVVTTPATYVMNYPTFGTLGDTSEIHYQNNTTTSAFVKTAFTYGRLFIDGSGIGSVFFSGTGSANHIIKKLYQVNEGCSVTYSNSSGFFTTMNDGSSLIMNGRLISSRATGWLSSNVGSSGTTFGSIQFIGSESVTLGANSVIELGLASNATAQTIVPRTDYKNLTITGADNNKSFTGATTVSGTLTLSTTGTGTFLGAANLTLGAGATIVRTSGNALNAAPTFGATTNVTYNGTTAITTGVELPTSGLSNLTINNAAGVTLGASTTVNGELTFTAGKITTGSNTLTIGTSGSISGAGTGWVVGNLKKLTASGSSPSYTYAIGNATDYMPVTLTFSGITSANGGLTASSNAGDHASIASSGKYGTKSVNRTWTLTNAALADFGTYDATFNYLSADNDAGATAANYAVGLYNGSSWSKVTTSGTSTDATTTATGISGFGDFAIGESVSTPAAESQTLCFGKTVADLTADGTALKWYAAATGGSALSDTIALSTSATYYVSQTIDGSQSLRTAVAVTVTPQTEIPTKACYETATWNTVTCAWDIAGSQPEQTTTLACYQTATWNGSTCQYDITGTQAAAPTDLACYQTATWNGTSCQYDVTGTQAAAPTGLACYQTATWNGTSCQYDIAGAEPEKPSIGCGQSLVLNNSCQYEVSDTRPSAPTGLACYQTATWNDTLCDYDVTGTQDPRPTTACYESAEFNTTSCSWVVTGTQAEAPTVACYQTATWNGTSCQYDITGTQAARPTTACYESAEFNTTSCSWVVTGTQPAQTTTLACYQTATWNGTLCQYDITGTQAARPTTACYESAEFNTTSCSWDVTGSKPAQTTTLACYETATWNGTSCQYDITGSQPAQPTGLGSQQTATWNAISCQYDVTGNAPVTLPFTTSTTWRCPNGVTSVQVEAWGGGGGGAGTTNSTNIYTGGGGAGGNYAKSTSVTVVPGTTYTITVGAGGAGGTTSGTALNATTSNGGTSSFGTVLYASGGQGGAGGFTTTKAGFGGANAGIYGFTITSGGTGYSANPTVTIGTAWTSNATYDLNQQVSNAGILYTVTVAGTSGTVAPTHSIGTVASTGGTASFLRAGVAATATAGTSGSGSTRIVNALTVVNPGSGYLTAPIVAFTGTNTTTATATALLNSTAINVTGATTYALGGNGGNGTYVALSTSNASGGGGASGGPLGFGNNGSGVTGGTAVTGSGAGANGSSTNATAGTNPTGFGGGGSGAVGASRTGGAGAAGKVVLSYSVANGTLATEQNVADFKSNGDVSMTSATNWLYDNGTEYITATIAPSSTNIITISSGHTATLTADFEVGTGSSLVVNGAIDLAGYKITGAGFFATALGATITLGDNASLNTGVTTTTKTFNEATNYVYNGTLAQNMTSLPATLTGNVTVSNAAGVVMVQHTTINSPGTLTVNAGAKLLFGDGDVLSTTIGSGTYNLQGTGAFAVAANATLVITSSKGLCYNTTSNGNLKNSGTRTFATGVNYIFAKNDNTNGINMGTSFGTEINATTGIKNLTISCPLNVFLPGAVGAVTGTLTPDVDITVNGMLNFTSGKLSANNGEAWSPTNFGTKTLTLASSATITGVSTTSYVVGNLKKLTATGDNASYTYPIGDATDYTPLIINFSGNTMNSGGLTVRTSKYDHEQLAKTNILSSRSVNRTWTLTNDALASFGTYSAAFSYPIADNDAIATPANYAVRLYNGSSWSAVTTSGTSTNAGTTATGLSTFGDFAIGEPLSAPTAVDQTLCFGKTVADLSATGTALKWYAEATGGSALSASTVLSTSATYYVSQTIDSFESARTTVAVTVSVQPAAPTFACYETATWDTTSCTWIVTGTQAPQPTVACYETATWDTTSCAWVVTGTQDPRPATACYETATFTDCAWVVTGIQAAQPTTACYETATWDTTSCAWVVTGTQAPRPTTACYETATFTDCSWVVTGTQAPQPTTACYETATFTDCAWVVTGTQAPQPTVACYETATWDITSCAWVVTGTQAPRPSTACYETATFTDCAWVVTGTQAQQPTVACYETATWDTTSCAWVVTGTQAPRPSTACYETATFTDCAWVVTGTQAQQPTTLACYQTATWNGSTCQYDITGTQAPRPTTACYETATFTDCAWVVTGTAPNAGTNGTLSLSDSPSDAALFAALTAADIGGSWSRPSSGYVGVYTYTINAILPCTVNATATVTVTASTEIPSAATLTFCKGATIATATGTTSLKFYTLATGGAPLAGTTALTTKTLYLTETKNGNQSTTRVAKSIVVNALPTATALVLTNPTAAVATTAVTAIGCYVGADKALKLTATAAGASSYNWILPSGVVRTDADGESTITDDTSTEDAFIYVKFTAAFATGSKISVQTVNASGCTSVIKVGSALTKVLPSTISKLVLTDGTSTTAITKVGPYMGVDKDFTLTATAVTTQGLTPTSYRWVLPAGVSSGLNTGTFTSTSNVITVNFKGVTDPSGTTTLPISVYAVNGVGASVAAKLLNLTRALPTAPTKLVLTDGTSTTAITVASIYAGVDRVFTLTAVYTANPLQGSEATKYKWVLPAGVSVSGTLGTDYIESATTAGITTVYSLNKTININLKDVTPGVTAIAINAYAVNGAGTSTARLLNLTRPLPTVVSAVTGSLNVCNRAEGFSYTITANATATKYLITGPAGSLVTSVSSPSNATNVLTTSDLTFTVVYIGAVTVSTKQTLTIKTINGAGTSTAVKSLALTKLAACSTLTSVTKVAPVAEAFKVVAYPNPSTEGFKIKSSNGKSFGVQVYDMLGRSVEQRQLKSDYQIGSNYAKGIYNVIVTQGANVKTLRVIKK